MKLPSLRNISGIYAVEDSVLRGRYSEIIIRAPSKEVRLCCDPDTDELRLSSARRKKRVSLKRIVTGNFRVEWMWAMTNEQGYFDGLRIQLAAKTSCRVFEFISIASCIEAYEAKRA
jgi:hypothetical protein